MNNPSCEGYFHENRKPFAISKYLSAD